jgi:hypothetical protein
VTSSRGGELSDEEGKDKEKRAKLRLSKDASKRMTLDLLRISDSSDEIVGWLRRIGSMLK